MPGGKKDLLGERGTNQVHQLSSAPVPVADAQPHRRDAEFRVVRGEAQVTTRRDANAATNAPAVDHRNRRLAAFSQAPARKVGDCLVMRVAVRRRPGLLELRYVGAGDERRLARAVQHDDPNLWISLETVENRRNRLPHLKRYGVATRRIVERDPADGSVNTGPHLLGRQADGGDFVHAVGSQSRLSEWGARSPTHGCDCRARGAAAISRPWTRGASSHRRLLRRRAHRDDAFRREKIE